MTDEFESTRKVTPGVAAIALDSLSRLFLLFVGSVWKDEKRQKHNTNQDNAQRRRREILLQSIVWQREKETHTHTMASSQDAEKVTPHARHTIVKMRALCACCFDAGEV